MNTIKDQKTPTGFLLLNNKTDKMPDTPSDNKETYYPLSRFMGTVRELKISLRKAKIAHEEKKLLTHNQMDKKTNNNR